MQNTFNSMQKAGVVANVVTYNTMISAYANHNLAQRALETFQLPLLLQLQRRQGIAEIAQIDVGGMAAHGAALSAWA